MFVLDSIFLNKFYGTHLLQRRVPTMLKNPRQNVMSVFFFFFTKLVSGRDEFHGTCLYKRRFPRKPISLISFKTVLFYKIILKIKLLSKIPPKSVIKKNTSNYKGTRKKKKKKEQNKLTIFIFKKVGMEKIPSLLQQLHKIDYFFIHVERVLYFYIYKLFISLFFLFFILYSSNHNLQCVYLFIFHFKLQLFYKECEKNTW